jgi:hypothetical protein
MLLGRGHHEVCSGGLGHNNMAKMAMLLGAVDKRCADGDLGRGGWVSRCWVEIRNMKTPVTREGLCITVRGVQIRVRVRTAGAWRVGAVPRTAPKDSGM